MFEFSLGIIYKYQLLLIDPPVTFSIEKLGEIDSVIGNWCIARVPPEIKNEVDHDYEVDGQSVSLFEVRPLWHGPAGEFSRTPFVKFRYVKSSAIWKIYWRRQSGKWDLYTPSPSAKNLKIALAIIESDQFGCFFG
jgi:hypothetical protein